jgi:hypothetical protein
MNEKHVAVTVTDLRYLRFQRKTQKPSVRWADLSSKMEDGTLYLPNTKQDWYDICIVI